MFGKYIRDPILKTQLKERKRFRLFRKDRERDLAASLSDHVNKLETVAGLIASGRIGDGIEMLDQCISQAEAMSAAARAMQDRQG